MIPRTRKIICEKDTEDLRNRKRSSLDYIRDTSNKNRKDYTYKQRTNSGYRDCGQQHTLIRWKYLPYDNDVDGEDENDDIDVDYREVYRKTLQHIHQYDTDEKQKRELSRTIKIRCKKENETKNKFVMFAMEHDILLQIMILLPVLIMVIYIVLVENGKLFSVIN